jgi:nucleoside-triphosphatase THEP1
MVLTYHSDRFIDREAEIQHILDIINSVSEKTLEPHKRVLHIKGRSGIGKSWLLKECNTRLSQDPRILSIYLTFDEFINQTTKEAFIATVLGFLVGQILTALSIKSPFVSEGGVNLLEYSRWIYESIRQVQQSKIIVFLIDEISLPPFDYIEVLEDLLATIIYEPNIVIILAGRSSVTTWKDFSLRPFQQENVMELEYFDLEKTIQQLQKHKPGSEHLAEKIIVLSDGSPGNNDIILNYVTGEPLEIKDELKAVQACNDELRKAIQAAIANLKSSGNFPFTSDDLRFSLDALCVLQDFDRDDEAPMLLKAHPRFRNATQTQMNSLLELLNTIKIGPGGLIYWDRASQCYAIERQTRRNLERELKLRDVELWKTLHCTAIQMYQDWADEFDLPTYQNKADYHREQLILGGIDLETSAAKDQE